MANILARYSLEGWYRFNGIGKQAGEVFYCDDGKVLGHISDVDPAGISIGRKKLLAGYRNQDGSSLGFLKISPSNLGIAPILWSMRSDGKPELVPFEETYRGVWGIASGIELDGALGELAEREDLFEVKRLSSVDIKELKTMGLFEMVPADFKARAEAFGQIGEITLKRQE